MVKSTLVILYCSVVIFIFFFHHLFFFFFLSFWYPYRCSLTHPDVYLHYFCCFLALSSSSVIIQLLFSFQQIFVGYFTVLFLFLFLFLVVLSLEFCLLNYICFTLFLLYSGEVACKPVSTVPFILC